MRFIGVQNNMPKKDLDFIKNIFSTETSFTNMKFTPVRTSDKILKYYFPSGNYVTRFYSGVIARVLSTRSNLAFICRSICNKLFPRLLRQPVR